MNLGLGGIVSVGGTASGGSASGIQIINPGNNTGPTVEFQGVNGIQVTSPSTNVILINGAALSGTSGGGSNLGCFEQDFMATTSGFFQHNLGTRSLVVQISDNSFPPRAILPDAIIFDTLDALSVLFNAPQAGSITVLTCGTGAVSGVQKFSQALTGVVAASVVHGLGSEDVIIQIRDTNQDITIPDRIRILDLNTVLLQFNSSFSGRVVIVG